jgi:serine protease
VVSTLARWLVLAFVASLFLLPLRTSAAAPGPEAASPPLRPAVASRAATDSDIAPGRVVVKMKAGRSLRRGQSTYGALAIESRPAIGAQVWQVAAGREQEVARQLAADPDVEYAEPDRIARLYAVPNDVYYRAYQWNMPKVRAPEAWDVTTGGASVIVAVIDSGFDIGHPDRPANLLVGCDYVRWRGSGFGGACPYVSDDANGHGTHVAGIVAARQNNALGVTGVAPGVTVLAIRTADASGSSYVSDVSAAIREATDAGAKVINLSLGGPSSTNSQRSAVSYAVSRGVVVVAAMGNDYEEGNPTSYPAAYSGVVAVGAGTHDDQRASYSNTGSHISLVAPGGGGDSSGNPLNWIASLYPLARGEYRLVVGTSQATPHVAGAAGLLFSVNPLLSGVEVANLLRATARPLGGAAPNVTFGYGYLDVDAAVRAARGAGAAPTATPTSAPATATPSPTPPPPTATPSPTPAAPTATPPPSTPTATPPTDTGEPVRLPAVPAGGMRLHIPLAERLTR